MNLVVNNQGVLQYMTPINNTSEEQYPQQQQYPSQQQQYPPQQQYRQQVARKNEPLDPSVKHSYIFNKYFKDYKDVNEPKPVKVPKTREEYILMMLEES
jgi:FtsZ-interacting cell division protein ZipA